MVEGLSVHLDIPHLPNLVHHFLHEQLVQVDADIKLNDVPLSDCPVLTNTTKIHVFPSAVAIYYAPSDLSGTRGMFCEHIQAVNSWWHGPARHDCVFVQHDPNAPGFRGLYIAWVCHFFPSVTTRPIFHAHWSPGIQLLVPHCVWTLEYGRLSPILIIWVI